MRTYTYATVCSGVECCSLAINAAHPTKGAWAPVFFSEIAPFPSAVLAHHYPSVPNLGDMTKITATEGLITNGTVDIVLRGRLTLLAGGTPCQDFSTAGLRAGAAQGSGTRSSLCWDYLRLVAELRPRIILWENVMGALSTNGGGDFSRFVAEVTRLGYGVAWRVLDSQYTRVDRWPMAIPQRRRRVWLVGVADGDVAGAGEILFEPKGVLGDTPPCRDAQERNPTTTTPSVGSVYPTITARTQSQSTHGVEAGELVLDNSLHNDKVYPTIIARTQQLGNHGVEGSEIIVQRDEYSKKVCPTIGTSIGGSPNSCEPLDGRIILEPDHATLHDTERCLAGNHDSRVGDGANVVCDPTLTAGYARSWNDGEFNRDLIVTQPAPVIRARRLMPIECERLMGYPENYTRIPYRGKPAEECPDGPRYEACGNGWAVNCARWVLLGIHRYLTTRDEQ